LDYIPSSIYGFCPSYESEFLQKLVEDKKIHEARAFNFTYRYIDNQILRRQTSRSHYGSKVPAVTITVFKYRKKIGKIVVKAVSYSVT
jgi:hypothetical protein